MHVSCKDSDHDTSSRRLSVTDTIHIYKILMEKQLQKYPTQIFIDGVTRTSINYTLALTNFQNFSS